MCWFNFLLVTFYKLITHNPFADCSHSPSPHPKLFQKLLAAPKFLCSIYHDAQTIKRWLAPLSFSLTPS